jgi:hydroxymethylbilane synthase
MAIEILSGNAAGFDVRALLAPLNHTQTAQAVQAERKVSQVFGGSCQIPLAAHATVDGDTLHLRAMVATADGRRSAFADASGPAALPEAVGEQVAQKLAAQDAAGILAECKATAAGDA